MYLVSVCCETFKECDSKFCTIANEICNTILNTTVVLSEDANPVTTFGLCIYTNRPTE